MTSTDRLNDTLDSLEYAGAEGLVRAGVEYEASGRGFVWRELHQKGEVDAAYFRGGVPLVAFVAADTPSEVQQTHRRLWNLSRVPVLIACTDSDVGAFSCFVAPEPDLFESRATLTMVSATASATAGLREFSRFHLESGEVSTRFADRFRRSGRVDRVLLENLRSL